MRPSPFTGKFKRKQFKAQKKSEDIQQKRQERQQPKLNLHRKSVQKKQFKQQSKNGQQDGTSNMKLLRPKLGLKKRLNPSPRVGQTKNVQEQEQQRIQTTQTVASKPKLFSKGRDHKLFNRNKSHQRSQEQEKIVIQQQSYSNNINIQESHEESYSQSTSMAPKFKLRRNQDHQQPVVQEYQVHQQQKGQFVSNFADLQIETRQINIAPTQHHVSQVKIQKQRARTNQLNKLLNLQIDLFQQTLSIACVTPYEIYISKIKGGSLKNSNDQAFDQKMTAYTQTLPLELDQFTNQCPQDYHMDAMSIVQTDETQAFNKFIQKISPVIEQLIKPSNTIVMPPIFLLALRPEFKKFVNCPFPVFIYYSQQYKLGVVAIGQKLYICESQITAVISINNNLIGGTKDGNLVLWSGKNNRTSRQYSKIFQLLQSTNFQLPECDTAGLDKFSVYSSDSKIVSFLDEQRQEFISLDETGKMIKWSIQNIANRNNQFKPQNSVQLASAMQRQSLIAYEIQKRGTMYFVSTSAGIIVWDGKQICQKLDFDQGITVVSYQLPVRSNLVYAVCTDNVLRVYEQTCSPPLLSIHMQVSDNLNRVFIPEIEYQNRKISLTNHVYLTTQSNKIFSFNLLENRSQGKNLYNSSHDEQDKSRNIIHQGVNKVTGGFQMVTLWKDLKCTTQVQKMDLSLEPSPQNVKHILQENRRFMGILQAETGLSGI